jgi:small-conductance mechanosensitive channel
MPDLVNLQFYGNSLRAWIIAIGIFVVVGATLVVVRGVLARRLAKLAARTRTSVDDAIVDLLRRTRYFFILSLALAAAAVALVLPARAMAGIRVVGSIALFLQIAIWGNGLITFWLSGFTARRAATDGESVTTIGAFAMLGRIVLWIVVVLLALSNLGYNVTALLTGLGVGGIAVALAVQNILGDLFGALSIVVDKPFVVGDAIEVDGLVGTVERIGLKSTRIRALGGEQIIFSNADLLRSRIRNHKRLEQRRAAFNLTIAYDTPAALVARIPSIIREIVEPQPLVRFDRSHFRSFGDSALLFETVYFVTTPDYVTYCDTQQAINLALFERFAAEGIEFAFPTRTVVVRAIGGGDARSDEVIQAAAGG